ncbi:hypothetical protein F66182_10809, partial [Fusarium sp. NRRL 66182]
MATGNEKLAAGVVPLSSRKEVHESFQTCIIFCVLIAIWSLLRLCARRVRYTPLHVEDALFYVSVASFYGMVIAFFLLMYLGGIGYHMDQLQKSHIARLTQTMLAIQGLYGLSMCTSKWSILWMLKRIFAVRTFWATHQVFTWVIIIVQATWMLMTVIIGFVICRPIRRNWDPTAEGTCGDQIAAYTAVSIVNVAVDVAMCILPLPMIWGLQVKKPYKMALFGIFSIGIVTIIFAVLRLLSLRSIDFDDFSYTVPKVITWTCAETGVVLIVACSPLLRPIFDKAFTRFLSNSRSRTRYNPAHDSRHTEPNIPPRMNHRMRSGFVNVGESEENLELQQITSEVYVKPRAMGWGSTTLTTPRMSRSSSDKDLTMGIV